MAEAPRTTEPSLLARSKAFGESLVDRIPGVHRVLSELVRVEVFDRSIVIAAQALLGLIPLLIVLVALLPNGFSEAIVHRFEYATGVETDRVANLGETTDQVKTTTSVVGLLTALFAATSFAGAVQRMLEHVWSLPHLAGVAMRLRGLLWFVIWLSTLQLSSVLSRVFGLVLESPLLELVTQTVTATLVWWWSARVLLVGRVSWGLLAPAAVLTGLATAVYSITSDLWMPRYVVLSVSQFRTLGLVLALSTWLIGLSLIITVSAIVGHVFATRSERSWRLSGIFRRRREGQGVAP